MTHTECSHDSNASEPTWEAVLVGPGLRVRAFYQAFGLGLNVSPEEVNGVGRILQGGSFSKDYVAKLIEILERSGIVGLKLGRRMRHYGDTVLSLEKIHVRHRVSRCSSPHHDEAVRVAR
eukprot:Mycagemm_TRINITY_DN9309_c0_g3::TRINITY_DN9309_c0_g3_i1::g.3192::m.3192 type:complete len:120 gc:universal TRINITY_DN9309_c0_g3_i1:114-473(+)